MGIPEALTHITKDSHTISYITKVSSREDKEGSDICSEYQRATSPCASPWALKIVQFLLLVLVLPPQHLPSREYRKGLIRVLNIKGRPPLVRPHRRRKLFNSLEYLKVWVLELPPERPLDRFLMLETFR